MKKRDEKLSGTARGYYVKYVILLWRVALHLPNNYCSHNHFLGLCNIIL